MEDEGFVDDSFIEEAAWKYVSLHGRESVALLLRLAEATERAGDALSAQTWRAIADAAERILALE
jgi:hypothetical protein